ncbi:hypothetical protein N9F42_01055 [Pseudomonadales bacterium]|nr:hypothetical protein [Pseudomonadales bacterium]
MKIQSHRNHTPLSVSIALSLALLPMPLHADTDDADSLDFESFHAEDNQRKIVKNPELVSKKTNSDKTKTTSTHYNTADALAFLQSQVALYKAMDSQCPDGWVKTQESSRQNKQQHQLTFSFNCLQ